MKFSNDVPLEVQAALLRFEASGTPLRVYYGDNETGRDWLQQSSTIGKIAKTYQYPTLDDGNWHASIEATRVVRIQDVQTGKDVYMHPKYHQPTFTTVKHMGGYEVRDEWHTTHNRFNSKGACTRWIQFITGERSSR